jgi:sporulation protein YlmC with PRC-barrel domain
MLRSVNDLMDYAIHATDGDVGHVKDIHFDDTSWVIRYLVVDTGEWLDNRKVLISPIGIGRPNWGTKTIPVSITKLQVENSPIFDGNHPVTKQHEVAYLGYYNYPYYWGGTGLWGHDTYPSRFSMGSGAFESLPLVLHSPDPYVEGDEADVALHYSHELHSGIALEGGRVVGTDGEIGYIRDMLVDDESWALRYLVVDCGDWWPVHQVLIAPQWITDANWPDATFTAKMTRQQVKGAPHYDSKRRFDRTNEIGLHEHYGRIGYWIVEVGREEEAPID